MQIISFLVLSCFNGDLKACRILYYTYNKKIDQIFHNLIQLQCWSENN